MRFSVELFCFSCPCLSPSAWSCLDGKPFTPPNDDNDDEVCFIAIVVVVCLFLQSRN